MYKPVYKRHVTRTPWTCKRRHHPILHSGGAIPGRCKEVLGWRSACLDRHYEDASLCKNAIALRGHLLYAPEVTIQRLQIYRGKFKQYQALGLGSTFYLSLGSPFF